MKATKFALVSVLTIGAIGSAQAITTGESAALCWGVHAATAAIQNDSRMPQEAQVNIQKATAIYERYQNDQTFLAMKDKILLVTKNDPSGTVSLLAKSAKSSCGGAGMSLPYGIPGEPLSKSTL